MGVMRFLVYPSELLDGGPDALQAYVSGFDGRVHPTRVELDDNVLICRRAQSDSGKLNIRFPVSGFGTPVICTTSLRERDDPYILPLELARGKIGQLRNQLSVWEIAGMTIPDDFREASREVHALFAQAVLSQQHPDEAAQRAIEALEKACAAGEILAQGYTTQRLMVRHQRSLSLPVSLGCDLGRHRPDDAWADLFCPAFNAAVVPVEWKHIEPDEGVYHWELNDAQVDWCEARRLLTVGGPLLDLSVHGLPEWLRTWENDFLNLQSFVSDFVETAVSRYIGRIRHWEIAARCNTGGALSLTEENRLALVARVLEVARQVDEEILLRVRIEQPWGDYQVRGNHRLSPVQFVDAIVRSGVGLSEVNLEIAVGYQPHGCPPRDLLDFSRMLDVWSCLGIPLNVTLAFPSSTATSNSDASIEPEFWRVPTSEQAQEQWIDQYLPLLMAKDSVVGVYICHFFDSDGERFANAGLIGTDGARKQALDRIIGYQREYWRD